MGEKKRVYAAIDLKSFYASVECAERGLDPMNTNLVVADSSRTEKTICLAVSPALKAYGIPGRARLFEVVQRVKEINSCRQRRAPGNEFSGSSYYADELAADPGLELSYITAPPRMGLYMRYSTEVYSVYLEYVAPEDIHPYSIDEVFIDLTPYLRANSISAYDMTKLMLRDVFKRTGMTATAGLGTNLYLAKIAMDIVAKHAAPDRNGIRIAALDELRYRRMLWDHRPITDFWMVGRGYAKRLGERGIYTMGDIAACSAGAPNEFYNEELLYDMFGVNAELLIDHAWGWEPCTIADIKSYTPQSSSISSGQVLQCPYTGEKAGLIVREMAEQLSLDLVDKGVKTDHIVLTIGYDVENLKDPNIRKKYRGKIVTDHYGRAIPKHAHGSSKLDRHTSSSKLITAVAAELYDRIINKDLLVRRITIAAENILEEGADAEKPSYEQLDLFTDYEAEQRRRETEKKAFERERSLQRSVLGIKKKYGKNAVMKGLDLCEGATARERNSQIGGHKA